MNNINSSPHFSFFIINYSHACRLATSFSVVFFYSILSLFLFISCFAKKRTKEGDPKRSPARSEKLLEIIQK